MTLWRTSVCTNTFVYLASDAVGLSSPKLDPKYNEAKNGLHRWIDITQGGGVASNLNDELSCIMSGWDYNTIFNLFTYVVI